MALATTEEVLKRWAGSEKPSAQDETLNELVGDAEALVLHKYPSIEQRIIANKLPARLVKMVIAGMVQRAFELGQDGVVSYSYSTGPFSESTSYGTGPRGLYFTDEDIRLLSPDELGRGGFTLNLDQHRGYPYGYLDNIDFDETIDVYPMLED